MSAQGDLFERATEPTPPAPPGPLAFSCAYRGFAYAAACRAKPGEPCRWTRGGDGFHAERRIAAGERLETYEDAPGAPEVVDEPGDGDEESDAIVESEKERGSPCFQGDRGNGDGLPRGAWQQKEAEMEQTNGLKVFCAEGGERVIATDPADAAKVYEETIGEPYEPHGKRRAVEWVEEDDGAPLTVDIGNGGDAVEKTRAEWVAELGRGHLCSENY